MKKILKKLAISIMIIITIASAINIAYITPIVQAADDSSSTEEVITFDGEIQKLKDMEDSGNVSGMVDGIAGLATYAFKAMFYGLANLLRVAVEGIMKIGGGNASWSIDSILFTGADDFEGVELVNINFFDTSENATVTTFRNNVAIWYYGLRNLAIVILLGILIYVGIRMAISTVATDEAKYKKMLDEGLITQEDYDEQKKKLLGV